MSMNVLVISSSLRAGSNSDQLADAFVKGAKDAGHDVEKIQLKGKKISFCLGCLACQKTKTGHCIQKDDADDIIQKIKNADVVVFASPIYYYTLSGQLKTLLDRANPLYPIEYRFRDVYLLLSAAEDEETTRNIYLAEQNAMSMTKQEYPEPFIPSLQKFISSLESEFDKKVF